MPGLRNCIAARHFLDLLFGAPSRASAGSQSVSGGALPRELPECSHKPLPESFRKANLRMRRVINGLWCDCRNAHILLDVRLCPLSGCNSEKSFGTSAGSQHPSTRVRTRHFHAHRWQRPKTSPAPVSMQAILKHCGVWQHVVALVRNHMTAVFCCFSCVRNYMASVFCCFCCLFHSSAICCEHGRHMMVPILLFFLFPCSSLVVQCTHGEHDSQQSLPIRSFVLGCPGSSVWKAHGGKFHV